MNGRKRIPDLSPDDTAARLAVGGHLRAVREALGMSRATFAAHMVRAKGSIQALVQLHALALTNAGQPGDPLYLRRDAQPVPYTPPTEETR